MRSLAAILTLFLLNFTSAGNCYKILTILPTPFRSHAIIGESVVKQLARAGHEVTLISPFRLDELNVRNVVINDMPDGKYMLFLYNAVPFELLFSDEA